MSQPAPTVCPTCGNQSVYTRTDKDTDFNWVSIKWCNVCQKRVAS